jgi:hypothetical protein
MSDQDSATREWERRIETALDPGRYVPEHACFGYVAPHRTKSRPLLRESEATVTCSHAGRVLSPAPPDRDGPPSLMVSLCVRGGT